MILSTKAKTLEILKDKLKHAKVLPLVRFSVKEFQDNEVKILEKITKTFKGELIVRSSSENEDNEKTSNAGGFESVLHVKEKGLRRAICKVISSFGENCLGDEIFVQPMLQNVRKSGVVFTADIDTLSPYYIVNYDESSSTCKVTSGDKGELKTFICHKAYEDIKDEDMRKLLLTCKELESIFKNSTLDIEFAYSKEKLYVFQVRQIVRQNKEDLSSIDIKTNLFKVYKKIEKLNAPHPKVLGDEGVFGVMPDWNPAEIIGIRPKMLALSLYKELITDEIWAYQRDNYGYRNLRSYPLLISFLGLPYIDVRVSFNSFVPKNLNDSIAKKLINYYIKNIKENRVNHDKIEFEIIYSCYYFGIEKKLKTLLKHGFNKHEIKRVEFSLLDLTNGVLSKNGIFQKDLDKIKQLKPKYKEVLSSKLSTIDKIYWLIEDCKRYGTLPFAGIARAAFMAVQFLKSLESEDIITKKDLDRYINSLNTISKKQAKDLNLLNKKDFIKKYGHLRPGTYDITSLRYDEGYDGYFSSHKSSIEEKRFKFSKAQRQKIKNHLIECGIEVGFKEFMKFIKDAIEGREYAKFLFTKHLSKTLKLIEELGGRFGLSKEELAHLDIQTIKKLYSVLDTQNVDEIFKENIEKNKNAYKITKAIKLPSLITNKGDIYSFFIDEAMPNFITHKKVMGKIANVDDKELSSKIVCIASADPGYDFIFSKNIKALVTCYGGANSHMAIRCAELGIVGVIGCGEKLYEKIKNANIVELDASLKNIKILS